jgi:hypothetical protein
VVHRFSVIRTAILHVPQGQARANHSLSIYAKAVFYALHLATQCGCPIIRGYLGPDWTKVRVSCIQALLFYSGGAAKLQRKVLWWFLVAHESVSRSGYKSWERGIVQFTPAHGLSSSFGARRVRTKSSFIISIATLVTTKFTYTIMSSQDKDTTGPYAAQTLTSDTNALQNPEIRVSQATIGGQTPPFVSLFH